MAFTSVRNLLPEFINENVMYLAGNIRYKVQPYVSTEFTADKITDRIFVGDLASASNLEELQKNNITHVVSVINGGYEIFDSITYKIIHINDDAWVDIKSHFDGAIEFIENALNEDQNNNIMVHCQRGVSRSVSIVMAYLLKTQNDINKIPNDNIEQEVLNTLNNIKESRSIAEPNLGFMEKINEYIKELNNQDNQE
jgi:protein tyrosine phosphatase